MGELALILKVSHRSIKQIWQEYSRRGAPPTVKKPGRPKKLLIRLPEVTAILETYDRLKVNAVTLEPMLKHNGTHIPCNRIHTVLKEARRVVQEGAQQQHLAHRLDATGRWIMVDHHHGRHLPG